MLESTSKDYGQPPHTWGIRCPKPAIRRRRRSTPAVNPRIRGEYAVDVQRFALARRSTPAYAGNTLEHPNKNRPNYGGFYTVSHCLLGFTLIILY